MTAPRPISKCRICGSTNLLEILDLGEQALTGRFMRPEEPDPTRGPLKLVLCHGPEIGEHCGLLQLSHTYESGEMYGETYGYRSSLSRTMVEHLGHLVTRALSLTSPRPGDAVLDIGCNDGTLLGFYVGMGLRRYGVDPSSAKFRHEYPEDVGLLVDCFSPKAAAAAFGERKYKIITSIAMFYDLDDPMSFMRDVRDCLDRDGIWITEQSHMGTMLKNLAFDSVCHEHLNYYNLKQIQWMAERRGLKLVDAETNAINGASFCVTLARDDSSYATNREAIEQLLEEEEKAGFSTLTPYRIFADRITLFRRKIRNFFAEVKEAGELVLGYGASTKGNVVLQYCGIAPKDMPAIAEKYSWKFGLVTPGSRIPIIPEEEARARRPDYLFVLPWHFRDEIIERERLYLEQGGALVFALPRFEIVRATNRAVLAPSEQRRKIPWARPIFFGQEKEFVREAIESTYISGGPFIERFEQNFAALYGWPQHCAITVSNGTVALELVLRGLAIGPGDEVIVPGWCFAAAANMVLACGARPVFADVTDDTWLIDPASVAECISSRTKAVIAVHTWGNVCDLAALRRLADTHGMALIEDCAESLFSRYSGTWCGSSGDVATFSFQATKTLTCGEGGLVLARDPDLVERMRLIRNHGMKGDRKYWHHLVGHNFRLTNLQAAMLCAQWNHRDEIMRLRRHVFEGYRQRLAGVHGLALQRFDAEVEAVPWGLGVRISPAAYRINRDEVMQRMAVDGIECRPAFYAMSEQPLYSASRMERSEAISKQAFSPPISPDLSADELDFVCDRLLATLY